MQRMMTQQQGKPEDPLMQALSRQAMMGEMIKETANHKLKMLKLHMKYGNGLQQSAPPAAGVGGPDIGGGTY